MRKRRMRMLRCGCGDADAEILRCGCEDEVSKMWMRIYGNSDVDAEMPMQRCGRGSKVEKRMQRSGCGDADAEATNAEAEMWRCGCGDIDVEIRMGRYRCGDAEMRI